MWPRSATIFCRPSDSSIRRLTSMFVTRAKNTATNSAPVIISPIANTISQAGSPRNV